MNAACTARPAVIVVPKTPLDVSNILKVITQSLVLISENHFQDGDLCQHGDQCEERGTLLHLHQPQGKYSGHFNHFIWKI